MPVRENSPAPMMAPMPSITRLTGPRVRRRACLPSDCARMRSSGLVANRFIQDPSSSLIGSGKLFKEHSIVRLRLTYVAGPEANLAAPADTGRRETGATADTGRETCATENGALTAARGHARFLAACYKSSIGTRR